LSENKSNKIDVIDAPKEEFGDLVGYDIGLN
jgi:hypothetical protein